MARDWPADLWPTSFKGVPFWVERDKDAFGKRLVIHSIPLRDDPIIQDLGARPRTFDLTAYVVGDVSDAAADALVATMLGTDPGTLVLPAQGPIQAWAHTGQRDREKDKEGYFAFTLQFVRDGASVASLPTNYLAQLVYDANDALQGAAGVLLTSVTLQ